MLMVARQNNPEGCLFVHDDILQYLRRLPSESVDVVTCAWGLGYSQPSKVLHEISRVLKPGGRIGVIDNSILSLREMYLSAFQVLAEQPDALTHVLQIRFLLDHHSLRWRMRMKGLHVLESWGGSKRYAARTGAEAIARMKATGAAAGFEHSFNPRLYKQGEERFMEVLNGRYGDAIPIVHRYLAAVAVKP
jgi:SAM-dependent methyltransferase